MVHSSFLAIVLVVLAGKEVISYSSSEESCPDISQAIPENCPEYNFLDKQRDAENSILNLFNDLLPDLFTDLTKMFNKNTQTLNTVLYIQAITVHEAFNDFLQNLFESNTLQTELDNVDISDQSESSSSEESDESSTEGMEAMYKAWILFNNSLPGQSDNVRVRSEHAFKLLVRAVELYDTMGSPDCDDQTTELTQFHFPQSMQVVNCHAGSLNDYIAAMNMPRSQDEAIKTFLENLARIATRHFKNSKETYEEKEETECCDQELTVYLVNAIYKYIMFKELQQEMFQKVLAKNGGTTENIEQMLEDPDQELAQLFIQSISENIKLFEPLTLVKEKLVRMVGEIEVREMELQLGDGSNTTLRGPPRHIFEHLSEKDIRDMARRRYAENYYSFLIKLLPNSAVSNLTQEIKKKKKELYDMVQTRQDCLRGEDGHQSEEDDICMTKLGKTIWINSLDETYKNQIEVFEAYKDQSEDKCKPFFRTFLGV